MYKEDKPIVNLSEIRLRLRPRPRTMDFLNRFQSANFDENKIDKLIIDREKALKGSARAKLTNKESYIYDGNNVNLEPLSYRLRFVQRIAKDIFEGVGYDA
jgi:hypothetical protein